MRRTPPDSPPPIETKTAAPGTLRLEVELITRLLGGGPVARTLDPICWLRPPAVKSALRFWWRAGRARGFSTRAELRGRERELFGAAASWRKDGSLEGGPGLVRVEVTSASCRTEPKPYQADASDALTVAYFPAAPMGQDAAWLGAPGAKATVRIDVQGGDATEIQEVRDALALWLVLGGAGARSRRGAGALACTAPESAATFGLPQSLAELRAFLLRWCSSEALDPALDGVFSLARTKAVLLGARKTSGEQAQRLLLQALRNARQDRKANAQGLRRGRSNWPEADAIRLKVGAPFAHPPEIANAGRFPRAALGLPVVMHFPQKGEPKDHHILGASPEPGGDITKLERYASPVLLRPVRVWEQGTAVYVPVAIFTAGTLPADTLAFVTRDPRRPIAGSADPDITSYLIASEEDATLSRVQDAFVVQGFQPLTP